MPELTYRTFSEQDLKYNQSFRDPRKAGPPWSGILVYYDSLKPGSCDELVLMLEHDNPVYWVNIYNLTL
jgi:hypothetical protein